MADAIEKIVPGDSYGEFREYWATRKDGRVGSVTFLGVGGEWLIEEM